MIKVGVIFGGESVEHEVSIISAIQAMNKMDSEKYEIVPIYITKDGEWFTGDFLKEVETFQDMSLIKKYAKNVILYRRNGSYVLQSKGFFRTIVKEIDIAFPIVHGTNCEDGTIAGFVTLLGLPFVGPDIVASSIGMDKILQKKILRQSGISVVDFVSFYSVEYIKDEEKILKDIEKELKYPMIVKPGNLGSSVGIKKAKNHQPILAFSFFSSP